MKETWTCSIAAGLLLAAAVSAQGEREPEHVVVRRPRDDQHALDLISGVVRGRCVDGATGQPKGGCVVTLEAFRHGPGTAVPPEILRPAPVTTRADGRFDIRVAAVEDASVSLEITAAGCWARTGRWRFLVPGEAVDLGDIALYRGVQAVGKVVDPEGRPMPRVSVGIDELPLYLGAEETRGRTRRERLAANIESGKRSFHVYARNLVRTSTNAEGAFASSEVLPPGTYPLRISRLGLTLVEPTHVTIPERGPMEPITVVVREEPYLAGRVVDEKGEPISGVSLHADLRRSGIGTSGRSREDGGFRIYRIADSPDRVSVHVDDPGPYEPAPPTARYPWGKHDIEIVLKRGLTVDVRVVEAGTRRPIEDFAVRGYSLSTLSSGDRRLRLAGHHAGGLVTVDCIRRGERHRITAVPEDATLLPASVEVDGVPHGGPITIEVQRLVRMMVRVLDQTGQPVPHVQVLVIVPGNTKRRSGPDVVNDVRDRTVGAMSSDPDATFDTSIYSARTDGGGTCIVYGIDGCEDHVLGVRIHGGIERTEGVTFGKGHASREIAVER